MKGNKKLVIALTIILVILIGVVVVLFTKGDSEKAQGEVSEQQDTGEVVSTVEQQIAEEDAFEIETKYGKLYYPAKWEEQIRVEIVEDDEYVVEFYGTVKGQEEQHLFDVVFGNNDSIIVGTVESEGSAINVGYIFAEPSVEDWETVDADAVYAMQEDVNYLVGMLENLEGFTEK